MTALLSIDTLPQPRREAAWRDAVCDTFVRLECTPERSAPMHGRLEAGVLGNLHVARVTSSPQHVERTRERAAQDDQAFVLLSLQYRGRTVVRQAGNEAVLTPGCIAFYDTARPYTLTLPNDFDQIVLHLPRDMVNASVPRGLDHMAQKLSASNPFAQTIIALGPQLLTMMNTARPSMAARTAAAAVELISLALDSLDNPLEAPAEAAESPRSASAVADALAWRARELIGHQLDDAGLTPSRLASQMHVSLRRLQEVFHGQGTTLTDCIWDARLEFARGLLALVTQRQESVSTIAMRSGFSDVAHFCRRFKQRYGLPPSEYRAGLH
jgi:AraC-like DNA-binding protein